MCLNQSTAVAPAHKPSQRAFRLIGRDAATAELGCDLPLRQREMLAAECVDGYARYRCTVANGISI
jgi:hypothetical protein